MGSVKVVDADAMRQAASALGTYMENIQNYLKQMEDAAQDCSDNMGSDVISRKNIESLKGYILEMKKALVMAGELKERIQKKVSEIENRFGGE